MYITFGELNRKSLLFIAVIFFIGLRWLFESKFESKKNNFFFSSFLRYFGNFLAVFLYLFLKRRMAFEKKNDIEFTKSKSNLNNKDEKDLTYTINDENKDKLNDSLDNSSSYFERERRKRENRLKSFKDFKENVVKTRSLILILLVSFIDFCFTFIFHLIYELEVFNSDHPGGIVILSANMRLFLFAIISRFLIRSKKIHRHQSYSIIIIAFIVLVLFISSLIIEDDKNDRLFKKFSVMVIPELGFACIYSLGSLYLLKSKGNVYYLLFINGIISITLSILLQIIFSFFSCHKSKIFVDKFNYCDEDGKYNNILSNLKSFNDFGGWLSIGIIFTFCIENICTYLVTYYFSLNHYGALFAIPTYLRFVIDDYNLLLRIYYIIMGIIIVFMTLVYTEILILRFWGLESNTKEEIIKRSDSEYSNTIISLNKEYSNDEEDE